MVRIVGENRLAQTYAHEVLTAGTSYDGHERSPMRNAEARVTLGVVAARDNDLATAAHYGEEALSGSRKSLPSLLMCSRELGRIIRDRGSENSEVVQYLERLRAIADG